MTRYEFETRLEAAEKQNLGLLDEIKYLKEQLAKAQEEQEIPDKPDFEMDEKFYYLNSETDDVEDSCHDGDIDTIDFNMFHTREYAQEFADKCKLIAMMLHCKWYIDRDVLDTSEKTWLYGICYDKEKKKFVYASYCSCDPCTVTFIAEEAAKKAADWLNSHWKENDNDA